MRRAGCSDQRDEDLRLSGMTISGSGSPACPHCGADDTTTADRYGNHVACYCHQCHMPFAVPATVPVRTRLFRSKPRQGIVLPWKKRKAE